MGGEFIIHLAVVFNSVLLLALVDSNIWPAKFAAINVTQTMHYAVNTITYCGLKVTALSMIRRGCMIWYLPVHHTIRLKSILIMTEIRQRVKSTRSVPTRNFAALYLPDIKGPWSI